jgi:UDP-glucuronate 4-epimerase
MRVLVTGAAGFIGFHLTSYLLSRGDTVLGYDSLNNYYDPVHKENRLKILSQFRSFQFIKGFLEDAQALNKAWKAFDPEIVVNLAAQAGVRYSIENPNAYIQSNIVGFQSVLDLARETKPKNFVYASSSSVYGGNKVLPFSETQKVNDPVSLYAATKLANELFAKSYGNLFELPSTGLRFFTAYGPFSRPDMAMFKFAELIRKDLPIPVFNNGNMTRDFTYIDDIVTGITKAMEKPDIGEIYNLGGDSPIKLMDMISELEKGLGIKAKMDMLPIQPGDVPTTVADVSKARKNLGYQPQTSLAQGVTKFTDWYKEYRNM